MNTPPPSLELGLKLHGQGMLDEAERAYRDVLAHNASDPDAHHLLGLIKFARGRLQPALELIKKAIQIAPDDERYHLSLSNALRSMGLFDAALESLKQALAIKSDYLEARINRGKIYAYLGQRTEALSDFNQAITLRPHDPALLFSRAVLLGEMNLLNEALADDTAVLSFVPQHLPALQHRAQMLYALGHTAQALAQIDELLRLSEANATAHALRGDVLARMNRAADAVVSYQRAVALGLSTAELHNNFGLAHLNAGQMADALAQFERAAALDPKLTQAAYNRAQTLCALKRFDEAVQAFDAIRDAGQGYPYLAGNAFAAQLQCCDWTDYDQKAEHISQAVAAGARADTPFNFLLHSFSPELQLQAARTFISAEAPLADTRIVPAYPRPPQGKIRLAYLSADFNNHATALLAAGLFESHDRTRFETVGFSFSADDGSTMYRRLQGAFDRFVDVRAMADRDVANLMAELNINIAIDLKGHAAHSRPGIFSYRAADLQAHYLGYPGTLGAPYIDYLLADQHLIPPPERAHYVEKIVTLPGTYQVNDATRPAPAMQADRKAHGLPASGFVFCSFNGSLKINPAIFDIWMRLLNMVAGSVLWALADNPLAEANLRREAVRRNIAPERIIFARRMAFADHMARHACADLFLDTAPCNAHTTASDALWCGLPIVTYSTRTFAGRVCASLLRAAGLPELVTTSLAEYEALALNLATTPARLAALKAKLTVLRTTSAVFDLHRHRRNIEASYVAMWDRHQRGLPPTDMVIDETALQSHTN